MARSTHLLSWVLLVAALAAGCSDSPRPEARPDSVKVRTLVVAPDDAFLKAEGERLHRAVSEATAHFSDLGVPVTDGGWDGVVDEERAQVLVEFPEADEPCDRDTWDAGRIWEHLDEAQDEVTIVIGGTIRSIEPTQFFGGRPCGPRVERCESEATGGFILIDRRGIQGRLDFRALIAHELGHFLGLEHADLPGPCGRELVKSARDKPAALNLMSEVVHSGLTSKRSERRLIRLDDLWVSPAQVRWIRRSLGGGE